MRELYSTQLAITAGVLILIATVIFSLAQSPELLEFKETAAVKSARQIPHPIKGRQQCNSCHALKSSQPYPVKHAGWSVASCIKCHELIMDASPSLIAAPAGSSAELEKTGRAQSLPHPLEEMEKCGDCHSRDGASPYPENHAGRHQDGCTICHRPSMEKEAVEK